MGHRFKMLNGPNRVLKGLFGTSLWKCTRRPSVIYISLNILIFQSPLKSSLSSEGSKPLFRSKSQMLPPILSKTHDQVCLNTIPKPATNSYLRVSIVVLKHHDQEQLGKERICFNLLFVVYHPGTQSRNLSRSHGGVLPIGLLILLLKGPRATSPGATLPLWPGLPNINHQSRICTTGLPIEQCSEGILSVEAPYSKATLTMSSWDKASQHSQSNSEPVSALTQSH